MKNERRERGGRFGEEVMRERRWEGVKEGKSDLRDDWKGVPGNDRMAAETAARRGSWWWCNGGENHGGEGEEENCWRYLSLFCMVFVTCCVVIVFAARNWELRREREREPGREEEEEG